MDEYKEPTRAWQRTRAIGTLQLSMLDVEERCLTPKTNIAQPKRMEGETSGRGGSYGRGQPDEEGEVGRAAPGAVYCLVDACHVLITRRSPRLTTTTGASRKATCSNVATPERRTESDCWQSSLRTRTSTRMCGTGCYLP
jgi:hypothetical protein